MKNFLFTKALMAFLLVAISLFVTGCEPVDPGDPTQDDWVDLGLPSGLLWATRNVGASSPTDYGNYYAWGETTTKSSYFLSDYQYYILDSADRGYTKYCTRSSSGYNGFTDSLTVLQSVDDAATANYGGRTPTLKDWKELYNNTTKRMDTIDGVYGKVFTGPNGNSIFLPAAGSWYGDSHDNQGHCGYYWSASLNIDDPSTSYYFNTNNSGTYDFANVRHDGLSVRAVQSAR